MCHLSKVLARAPGDRPWSIRSDGLQFARDQGLVLVTRDEDFERLSALRGAPPKVVWLSVHNASNAEVTALLEGARERISELAADETVALLVLGG